MQEPDRIVRIRTVLARSGLSRSTLYRKIEKGTFPKQVRINDYCRGWRESEINRWIADPEAWRPMVGEAQNTQPLSVSSSMITKSQAAANDRRPA
jgi:prophage regulatory protein